MIKFRIIIRFAQCKTSATVSDLKNSFTIVFSMWYNLEKHVFFVCRKKSFFGYPGFSGFWGFPGKTVFFLLFSGQECPKNKIGAYSESVQRALSIDIHIIYTKKKFGYLTFRVGSKSARFIQNKKS